LEFQPYREKKKVKGMGRAALALFLRFAAKEQANSKKNFENFSKISNGGGYCKWEII